MNVKVTEAFNKDISKLRNKKIILAIKAVLLKIEKAGTLSEIPNVKKMEGTKNYFRVRIGDYRLGIFMSENTVYVSRFLNKNEIYRYFP